MDDVLIRWENDRWLRWLILFIGIHSCFLGFVMLFVPRFVIGILGFSTSVPLFFPSQCGVFLLILGFCYLRALVEPSFIWTILVSKTFAVGFLLVHVVFLSAPPITWAAAAGDAGMLGATLFLLHRHKTQSEGAHTSHRM
jgi:vacuolar-type H+-ATPase subunit I/STV1